MSTTIVAVACIPFSLIVACGFIWARGGTMNTLTLLGLIVGIGMLVDNAVVVIENIFRHREEGKDQKTAARLGASEVSTAVTAATLTSVIVFLPIIFNKPTEMNLLLKELGITVCAEGVEDAATFEFLKEIRCDKMQGFFISEAVMPEIIQRCYPAVDQANALEVMSEATGLYAANR